MCFATFTLMYTMSNIHALVHIDAKTEFEKDVECRFLLRRGPGLFTILYYTFQPAGSVRLVEMRLWEISMLKVTLIMFPGDMMVVRPPLEQHD